MNAVKSFKNLSKFELSLWLFSCAAIVLSQLLSGGADVLTACASLIGVTALIFVAKGDVLGQLLTVVFSFAYAVISYTFRYYGEMMTYLCMTMPIAAMAVVSWLRHPFKEGAQEVEVNYLKTPEIIFACCLAAVVTWVFYYILAYFETANLVPSTISVTTSFLASYLTFRRSAFYALAYAANDLVLIVLWVLATAEDIRYFAMVICFVMFFVNDMYGFINWSRMKKRQTAIKSGKPAAKAAKI